MARRGRAMRSIAALRRELEAREAEREAALAALRVSEARFRAIVEDQSEFISRFTPDLVITFVNPAYAAQLGRPAEALVGTSLLDLMNEDQRRRFLGQLARLTPKAPTVSYEMETVLPDGSEGWEHWTDRALFDAAGRVVEYQSVGRDVTQRRRAQAALRESEERLRLAVEATGLGTWDVNLVAGTRRWSPEFLRIIGLPPETVPDSALFAALIHPEDRDWVNERYRRAYTPEGGGSYQAEFRVRRAADGAERWVLAAGRIFFDAEGRPLRGIGTLMDVTERKRAEERLRLLVAELNHRVKNTLAVVQSIAQLSLAGDLPPAEACRLFTSRLRALAHAHGLLTAADWREADLAALLADELRPHGPRAVLAGPSVPLAPKAALTLALVLHELATNAAKHGALSVPEGRLEVAWGLEGSPEAGGELALRWVERGGPPVRPPARRGFGRTLLELGVRHDLGGRVELEFRPEGLVCELRAPAGTALAR